MSDLDEQQADAGFDPEARDLCPDGSCVGVIGEDGRCKVCGRPADPAAAPSPNSPAHSDVDVDVDANGDVNGDGDDPRHADAADRRLCPDGNCVGLIGPDGKCKVCGLAADATV